MRRGTYIAKQVLAAAQDGKQEAPQAPDRKPSYVETPARDFDPPELQQLMLNLIKKIYVNRSKIKIRGSKKISLWMKLTPGSTVKDCLTALSLITDS